MKDLKNKIEILFSQDFFADEFDPEGKYPELAENLLSSYSWQDIYALCFEFFITKCLTAKSLYNAINLYYIYSYTDNPIPNPYELLGYIYSKIDIESNWESYGDFVDNFSIAILEKCGKISLVNNPYYQSWKDPKIIDAAEKWKKNLNRNEETQ